MSYCRWSSDNYKCDIYAYESDQGWEIHVAGNRHVVDLPPNESITWDEEGNIKYDENKARQHQWHLDYTEREIIDLPYAGESIHCDKIEEFWETMLKLRGLGYHIPDYVFEEIEKEMISDS